LNILKAILNKFLFLGLLLSCFSSNISAQISSADRKKLREKEDTLRQYAQYMITDSLTEDRMVSDSIFTRVFVRSLQVKNSFYYPFDSVFGISKIYAPDSTFRIFTWNLQFDDYYSRQKGAIQMRTKDGSLKLFPLRDNSEFTAHAMDSVWNKSTWIGALYYNMVLTQDKGKKYYTLFGLDPHSVMSTKKWIEVLHFNEKNEPVFGGPFFSFEKDSVPKPTQLRFSMEFKKDARVMSNYIDDLGLILVDHLVSENDDPEHRWTYVPDGDNEGFKWENGKWVHIEKVFNYKIDMKGVDPFLGKPPVGDPLFDLKGNKDEKKLQEKTDKNKTKDNKSPVNYDN
jgi:hypothetical protein